MLEHYPVDTERLFRNETFRASFGSWSNAAESFRASSDCYFDLIRANRDTQDDQTEETIDYIDLLTDVYCEGGDEDVFDYLSEDERQALNTYKNLTYEEMEARSRLLDVTKEQNDNELVRFALKHTLHSVVISGKPEDVKGRVAIGESYLKSIESFVRQLEGDVVTFTSSAYEIFSCAPTGDHLTIDEEHDQLIIPSVEGTVFTKVSFGPQIAPLSKMSVDPNSIIDTKPIFKPVVELANMFGRNNMLRQSIFAYGFDGSFDKTEQELAGVEPFGDQLGGFILLLAQQSAKAASIKK